MTESSPVAVPASTARQTCRNVLIAMFVLLYPVVILKAFPDNMDISKLSEISTTYSFLLDNQTQQEDASNHDLNMDTKVNSATDDSPLVTFVVPSSLTRASLNDTIASLKNQTRSNWEAVVGVDVRVSNFSNIELINQRQQSFLQDDRIRYAAITTPRTERGAYGNGAGEVRNEIIRNHIGRTNPKTNNSHHWVAFVDDDDTVHPRFLEYLQQGMEANPHVEVLLFRMRVLGHPLYGEFPPLQMGATAMQNHVGISFAVRRHLMTRKYNPIIFRPHEMEDYLLLESSQKAGAQVMISNCVTYFVRHRPPSTEFLHAHYLQNSGHNCSFTEAHIRPWP